MINKNNYEEYFLMFADGELSRHQQNEVLQFIETHPEYQEAFREINLTKLNAEPLVFQAKETLLRSENKIDTTNYTAWFLASIDNELLEDELKEVEEFLRRNPQYADELSLLKRTVLPVEKVIFPDKKLLLRSEKVRRFPTVFVKYAAAAALISVAVLVWQLNATHSNIAPSKIPATEVAVSKTTVEKPLPAENQLAQATIQKAEPKEDKTEIKTAYSRTEVSTHHKPEIKEVQQEVVPVIKSIDQPEENIAKAPKEIKPDPNDLIAVVKQSGKNEPQNNKNDESGLNMPDHPALSYSNASYKVIDTKSELNESLYVGGLEINKNKVRGLLKKIGSAFNTKTIEEGSKDVRIANFQIQKNQ